MSVILKGPKYACKLAILKIYKNSKTDLKFKDWVRNNIKVKKHDGVDCYVYTGEVTPEIQSYLNDKKKRRTK